MVQRLIFAITCICLSTIVTADEIRGAFGFELSTNISNYEGLHFFATSDDEVDKIDGEKWRLYQIMEPLRRYYRVKFENVPSSFPIIEEGIVSAYEGWIATIIAKSEEYDSFSECQDQHDKFAQVLQGRYGTPLAFEGPSWYSRNKKFATYKHHTVMGKLNIWESDNAVLMTGCDPLENGATQFTIIYESGLWQKAVENWRAVMKEQRQLEKEKSAPDF